MNIRFFAYQKRQLISFLKRTARHFGYEIVSNSNEYFTMDGGLLRSSNRGIKIKTVIDIGASNGRWSELCAKHFPDAKYLLMEAQTEYEPYLSNLVKKNSNFNYEIGVVSNEVGDIYFDDHIVGGGIASKDLQNDNFKKMKSISVDAAMSKHKLEGPYLLKLDTHGYEIPIIEGATKTLLNTNLIVMECYNFKLNDTCLRFNEMTTFLESKGFRCIDIIDLGSRKKDKALWQMDIFFIRNDRPEFLDNTYE